MRFFIILLFLLSPLSAQAAWETRQNPNSAVTQNRAGNVDIVMSCRRNQPNRVDVMVGRPAGFPGVTAMMLWIGLPDGRLARHSIDAVQEGAATSGTWFVSDLVLDRFRNASSIEVTVAQTGERMIMADARGTGAARLAFLERCGF